MLNFFERLQLCFSLLCQEYIRMLSSMQLLDSEIAWNVIA